MRFCHFVLHFFQRPRCFFFFALLYMSSLMFSFYGYAQELEKEVEAVADDLQYIQAQKKIAGKGNVVVAYGDIELTADEAEINIETKEAHAKGHVVVRQVGHGALSGNEVFFNFETNTGKFPDGRFFQFPWYGFGEELHQLKKGKIKAKNVYITSCDLPHPHYDVKAQEAEFYPSDKIVAKNVTFRILEVPVFWLPYLMIPLNQSPGSIVPGYSDEFGGFVLTSLGYSVSENIKGKLLFNWYSERGFGFGTQLKYKFSKLGVGEVKIFGIRDKHAPDQRATSSNPYSSDNLDERNRGRVSWKHRARLDPFTTLHLQWHEISDERFLQDFFESEYREETDPQSFVTITRNVDKYSLLANVEKRSNRFQNVGEKLPEVVFTWLRKPLFGTNFYYTNEEGVVNFNQTKAFSADGSNTVQVYADQELSYPLRFFKFYNFIPFGNFREDYFSKSKSKEDGITRYVFGTGFDASTRFYRTWDYTGKFAGIELNQIRHIVEPIIQYNSIKIASVNPSKLVETGRGDRLDHQDIITLGIENRIQTKRKIGKTLKRVDIVSFNAFLDYSFGPGSTLLKTRANKFIEARQETVLRPYDWFALRVDTVYDLVDHEFSSNNLDAILDVGRLHITLSHRLTKNTTIEGEEILGGINKDAANSLITVEAIYDVNKLWDLGAYARWATDKNSLQEWQVMASRDLHDWLLDFGFNVRTSDRVGDDKNLNKEAFVQLQLKALPEISLKAGHRATFSDARIGRTISGSNEAPAPSYSLLTSDSQNVSLAAPY